MANVLDTNDLKDAACGVGGRVCGVLQGDCPSNADCEGHQIQFPAALMGSALHRHMGTAALCLSGQLHRILAYITSGRRSAQMVAPLSTIEPGRSL